MVRWGVDLWLLREWKIVVTSRVTLVCWFVISVWVSMAGPFGTYEGLDLLHRAVFWGGLIALGIVLGVFFRLLVTMGMGLTGFWPSASMISALNTMAFTPPLDFLVNRLPMSEPREVPTLLELALFVFLLTFGVAIVRFSLRLSPFVGASADPVPQTGGAPGTAAPQPALPRLLQRLDATLHADLVTIAVRDHYVDVRTRAGSASLLMRLADAVAETEGVDGAQVHRSHWVAWNAVATVEQARGSLALRLYDGHLVPVSRANRTKLEARGLI